MKNEAIQVIQLGSGSSGNLTAIRTRKGVYLVDAGFNGRECLRRLRSAGIEKGEIQALILTHAHTDHARGAALLSRRLKIPLLATPWTLGNLSNMKGKEILEPLPENGEFHFKDLLVETLAAPHDIPGTILLRINGKLGVATDLGSVSEVIKEFLSNLQGLLLEFNHDVEMLLNGPYPGWLKQRILSDHGHLSNAQARELLSSRGFILPKKALWLAHLSRENNRPEIALRTAKYIVEKKGIRMIITDQDMPSPPVTLA